jgi:penicillin-binding protein 2
MQRLENRSNFIIIFFLSIAVIYIVRLFYIQVLTDTFLERAKKIAITKITQYPIRGNIYDRYGLPLVQNEVAYDILITPKKLNIDTAKFCELLDVSLQELTTQE